MGDLDDRFKQLTELRKERHRGWKQQNMEVLQKSGIAYSVVNRGETVLFRIEGKPKVDFFPSTGRWMTYSDHKVFGGGATKFIEWLQEN